MQITIGPPREQELEKLTEAEHAEDCVQKANVNVSNETCRVFVQLSKCLLRLVVLV